MGPAATYKFGQMPNGETYTIKDAGHVCYDDRVLEFHLILYEFAKKVFNV